MHWEHSNIFSIVSFSVLLYLNRNVFVIVVLIFVEIKRFWRQRGQTTVSDLPLGFRRSSAKMAAIYNVIDFLAFDFDH